MAIVLNGDSLTIEKLVDVARKLKKVMQKRGLTRARTAIAVQ